MFHSQSIPYYAGACWYHWFDLVRETVIFKDIIVPVVNSDVTDGGAGVRVSPLWQAKYKKLAPLLDFSWTAENKSASTSFGNPLVLTF